MRRPPSLTKTGSVFRRPWRNTPFSSDCRRLFPKEEQPWPVSPFVVAKYVGTTRYTPTGCDCLAAHGTDYCRARTFALATVRFPDFYLSPTPNLVPFKRLVDDTRHRRTTGGSTRPSCISRNEMMFWVTWLVGLKPTCPGRCMSGSRHGIVSSSGRADFRGQRTGTPPYPSAIGCSPLPFPTATISASSPRILTGKGLLPFHA